MTTIDSAHEQLVAADEIIAVLGAVWDAFEVTRLTADICSSQRTSTFVTWMAVIPPACEGRDAIGFTLPALPDSELLIDPADLGTLPEDQAACKLAALAAACEAKLRAIRAPDLKTRFSTDRAKLAAEEIRRLLAGDG
jgi:hypothetical protein